MRDTRHYINLLAQAEKIFRHNRQGSYKTRERYKKGFLRFLRYLASEWRLQKLANIGAKHLTAYAAYMKAQNLSAATIKTDLAAIRFWHDQIAGAKHTLPANSALAIERRRLIGIDRTWSRQEWSKMISLCYLANREDYAAAITLARYMGLRIHEVFRFDTATARSALKSGSLQIKGKGGRIRCIPLQESCAICLQNLLNTTPQGQKLFVSAENSTHEAIKALQGFIAHKRSLVQDADADRRVTFHGLRHTCAVDWYKTLRAQGKSALEAKRQISLWLGHNRIDVVEIYLASIREEAENEKI